MTYRALAARANYSYAAVQAATAGKTLPTWEVTKALVEACDGDVEAWRLRWEEIDAVRTATPSEVPVAAEPPATVEAPGGPADLADTMDPGPPPAGPPPRHGRVRTVVLVLTVGVLALAVAVLALRPNFGGTNAAPASPGATGTTAAASLSVTASATVSPATSVSRVLDPARPPATSAAPAVSRSLPPSVNAVDDAAIQEQRLVELYPSAGYNWVDIEYWRHDARTPGELQMDGQGLRTALGAQLAIVADDPAPDRGRCAQVIAWTDRVDFSRLHVGSRLCGRSRAGRFASLQVRVLPGSPDSNGRCIFYGITWW